jgi:hypothetical protein
MAMNARESKNYLAISHSSIASKSGEISKVNFHVETKILVSLSEEI